MADLLSGVHPELQRQLEKIFNAMSAFGYPMRVTGGLRTTDQQKALYAQGRTKPGHVVTNCDGVKNKSNHQAKEDGFGHAVDCCFAGADPYLVKHPEADRVWAVYGALAEAAGLIWGGRFKTITDKPHVELP